jgi:hypothetical protein
MKPRTIIVLALVGAVALLLYQMLSTARLSIQIGYLVLHPTPILTLVWLACWIAAAIGLIRWMTSGRSQGRPGR